LIAVSLHDSLQSSLGMRMMLAIKLQLLRRAFS
jgi:hypothetical protein